MDTKSSVYLKYNAIINNSAIDDNLKRITNQIYRLLPVREEGGEWKKPLITLIEELSGMDSLLIDQHTILFSLLCKLEGLLILDEDFQLYTGLTFMNRKPVKVEYKGIHLLGDKVNLKISDDVRAQELAYVLLGTGIGTMNARGYGYCNYRWL